MTAPAVSGRAWAIARRLAAVAIVAALLWRVGADPFVAGLRQVRLPAVVAALALGLVATAANAIRWQAVAAALGLHLDLGPAFAACLRSQFLNSVLPGGVVGDVERGLRGRAEPRRGLGAVAAERAAGLLVLVAAGALALAAAGGARALAVTVAALGAVAAGTWHLRRHLPDWVGELLAARRLVVVIGASLVAVACYVVTFGIAAGAAGVSTTISGLVPLALVALMAMALPVNVAGWGPREGAAAWAFSIAGLGAAAGVTTSVIYGVLSLLANLPGALVMLAASGRTAPPTRRPEVVSHG